MQTTTIDFGKYKLRIRVLKPEAEMEVAPVVYGARAFVVDFQALGDKVRAPHRTPSGEDFGIAANLLRKYGKETLLTYAYHFWHSYSQPLFDNPQLGMMKLFTSRIPDIAREVT